MRTSGLCPGELQGRRKPGLAKATGGKCVSKCRPPSARRSTGSVRLRRSQREGRRFIHCLKPDDAPKEGRGCSVFAKQSVHEPTSGRSVFLIAFQKTARLFSFFQSGSNRGAASSAVATPLPARGHIHAARCRILVHFEAHSPASVPYCKDCAWSIEERHSCHAVHGGTHDTAQKVNGPANPNLQEAD